MKRILLTLGLFALFAGFTSAAKTLDIYFIDVEGGQSTLIVTPAGQSMLIDAGYGPRGGGRGGPPGAPTAPAPDAPAGEAPAVSPAASSVTPAREAAGTALTEAPGRDATRIMAAMHEAGLGRLDYVLVTHFHPDHVGGVPEVASRIPVGTFIDYGTPLGFDRMTAGGFRNYEPVRAKALHIEARAGDRLPLAGLDADIVSSGGALLEKPLGGGGDINTACTMLEDHPEDGTENFRSVGVMFRFGRFRFLNLGDLSGNTLTRLACPKDLLGRVSVYLVAHHGDYDSNIPALYGALRPQVAIMNNGIAKGGSPDAFKTLQARPGMDLWQLHASRNRGARNAPEEFLANVDDGITSYSLRLSANADGSFRIVNGRTGFSKSYPGLPSRD